MHRSPEIDHDRCERSHQSARKSSVGVKWPTSACALPAQNTGRGGASYDSTTCEAHTPVAHDRPAGDRRIAGNYRDLDLDCSLATNLNAPRRDSALSHPCRWQILKPLGPGTDSRYRPSRMRQFHPVRFGRAISMRYRFPLSDVRFRCARASRGYPRAASRVTAAFARVIMRQLSSRSPPRHQLPFVPIR